jgi:hypothetical protein
MIIPFELSKNLGHSWFIDLDGTILKHNGYLRGQDELLPGVKELWSEIPDGDAIVIVTGREEHYRDSTLAFLTSQGLRFDHAIFGLPLGERIVINDPKPEGLVTALAWSVARDRGFGQLETDWIKEWNSPVYQRYKKDNYQALLKYLIDPPKSILDIGCGLAFESRMFNHDHGSEIWLLDGDISANKSSQSTSTGYSSTAENFRFYHSFDWLKKELESRGTKEYRMVDVNNIDIPADKKFDVIWSFLSCGFHYPASSYRDLMLKHSHENTRIIVDLRTDLKTKYPYKEDCYEIVGQIAEGRKHITVEIKFR